MENLINYNGKIFGAEESIIKSHDHSYRYGDGLFETIKFLRGSILLEEYHFERLFTGLGLLKFKYPGHFTKAKLSEEIKELCERNKCNDLARVRLSVSRGNGGLYDCDNTFSYMIECWPLEQRDFNENGLIIDIFPDARKSVDVFSNLKSANYLPYVMAAVWARENRLTDALLLNSYGRICDATIANVFWVNEKMIFTPALNEGCVDGVMRKRIFDLRLRIEDFGFPLQESTLTEAILLEADEVFLTNAITGIRWVGQFRNKKYTNKISSKLFEELI